MTLEISSRAMRMAHRMRFDLCRLRLKSGSISACVRCVGGRGSGIAIGAVAVAAAAAAGAGSSAPLAWRSRSKDLVSSRRRFPTLDSHLRCRVLRRSCFVAAGSRSAPSWSGRLSISESASGGFAESVMVVSSAQQDWQQLKWDPPGQTIQQLRLDSRGLRPSGDKCDARSGRAPIEREKNRKQKSGIGICNTVGHKSNPAHVDFFVATAHQNPASQHQAVQISTETRA